MWTDVSQGVRARCTEGTQWKTGTGGRASGTYKGPNWVYTQTQRGPRHTYVHVQHTHAHTADWQPHLEIEQEQRKGGLHLPRGNPTHHNVVVRPADRQVPTVPRQQGHPLLRLQMVQDGPLHAAQTPPPERPETQPMFWGRFHGCKDQAAEGGSWMRTSPLWASASSSTKQECKGRALGTAPSWLASSHYSRDAGLPRTGR